MLRLAISRIRLRLNSSPCCFYSTPVALASVRLRLADKEHRSHFRSLESGSRKFKKGKLASEMSLRPCIPDFLVWYHLKHEGKLQRAKLGNPVVPSPFKLPAVVEIAMFHLLTGMYSGDSSSEWLSKLNHHLDELLRRIEKNKKFKQKNNLDIYSLSRHLDVEIEENSQQCEVLSKALECVSYWPSASESDVVAWIKSLTSASVTSSCHELTNLTNIPAFVTSDVLLRTPMSRDELYLQVDIWNTFMHSIGLAYQEKTSRTSSIIHNLSYYCVQFDPSSLPELISLTVHYFTSSKSGLTHRLVDANFTNHLIFSLAYYFIRGSNKEGPASMSIIKAQEHLVQLIGHTNLSQEGYVGVVLAISQVSEEKAQKLFTISQTHYHEHTTFFHIGRIHLSLTPEQLLHNFNAAVAQYPGSATMWLVFIRRLASLGLLSESRAQKLLVELTTRKDLIIISKDIVITLLQPIESINGIEQFISVLEKAGLWPMFKSVVTSKYLTLLYRFGEEKNVRKPYLDKLWFSTTNIDCARYLFQSIDRKTATTIGIMLNGEVCHQPQEVYNMYIAELQGKLADEHCLMALLRACKKSPDGNLMTWGHLYAPQVAVHEFKKNVAKKVPSVVASDGGVIPSNKLWKQYIHVLASSEYMAELAEVIRWWEQLQFIPSKSTLMLLLKALPREFARRHIKHAHAVSQNTSPVVEWPWPTLEEYQNHSEHRD